MGEKCCVVCLVWPSGQVNDFFCCSQLSGLCEAFDGFRSWLVFRAHEMEELFLRSVSRTMAPKVLCALVLEADNFSTNDNIATLCLRSKGDGAGNTKLHSNWFEEEHFLGR